MSDGGGPTVVDGLLDPERAARTLRSVDRVRLRLAPVAGSSEGEPYGPPPVEPYFVDLARGDKTVRLPGGGDRTLGLARVEVRRLSWGAWGGAAFEKHVAVVEVAVDDDRALLGQVFAADEAAARASAEALASAFDGFVSGAAAEGDVPASPALTDADRLAMVLEGDYLVLRDFTSPGPREHITRYAVLAAISGVLSALTWVAFARELSGARGLSALLGYAAVGVVLALGAVAMGEIARFASKYRAKGAPVAWFYDDRVVVAPWVSRTGAIDTQPEGRLGAAIRIAEVDDVLIRNTDDGIILTLDTHHGPIDMLTTNDAALADAYKRGIVRALVGVAAPAKRPKGVLALASA